MTKGIRKTVAVVSLCIGPAMWQPPCPPVKWNPLEFRTATMLLPYPRHSDRESIAADATHVIGMTPEERATIFIELDRTMEAILAEIPAAERRRRRDAARIIDPRPTPWWKNLRQSAWPREEGTRDYAAS